MDFTQLECFVRAYERENFSQAAADLYLAQTSLTYRIASLEKELGCPLFVRSRRGAIPTESAHAVYEDARALLERRDLLVEHAQLSYGERSRTVRVGFNRYPNVPAFFEAIEAFRGLFPDVEVETDFTYLEDPGAALENGTHDVVFLLDYEGRDYAPLTFVQLGALDFYVTMAETSPLCARSELTMADLAGQTVFVLKQLVNTAFQVPTVEELRACGARVDDSMTDNELLLLAIQVGRGVSVYPSMSCAARAGFARRPLSDCAPLRFGLLYSEERISPTTVRFIDRVVGEMAALQ